MLRSTRNILAGSVNGELPEVPGKNRNGHNKNVPKDAHSIREHLYRLNGVDISLVDGFGGLAGADNHHGEWDGSDEIPDRKALWLVAAAGSKARLLQREVDLPAHLVEQLNTSKEFLFTPSQSWKFAFYQAVRKAARELGIKVSGLHRLRSNYAQEKYRNLRAADKTKRHARQEVSQSLGHNRIDVIKSYIPDA